MKKQVFRHVSAFLFCSALALAPAAQAKPKKDGSPVKTFTASGCVTEGVEAGCLMLTDSQSGVVYNLIFSGRKKPMAGAAIRITATKYDGMTICMQGQAVKVRTWRTLKMKCLPKGSS